jgi:hypothetical protein
MIKADPGHSPGLRRPPALLVMHLCRPASVASCAHSPDGKQLAVVCRIKQKTPRTLKGFPRTVLTRDRLFDQASHDKQDKQASREPGLPMTFRSCSQPSASGQSQSQTSGS